MARTITRRRFLAQTTGLTALTVVLPGCRSIGSVKARAPNIILIMADDLGYGDVGCYGCTDIRTPGSQMSEVRIRKSESVLCSLSSVFCLLCTPTRTALLTGRYQHRVGGLECALANKTGNNRPFSGYKVNLFEGGIRVPCIVKWPGVLKDWE